MKTDSTAFLCGFFTAPRPFSRKSQPQGWTLVENDPKRDGLLKNYYYSEFVDFFSNDVVAFRKDVNSMATIDSVSKNDPEQIEKKQEVKVTEIMLYQMPMQVVIFSVRLDFKDVELNDIAWVLMKLRSCNHYLVKEVDGFVKLGLDPVYTAYQACGGKVVVDMSMDHVDYSFLIEYGNKLKIFQISALADQLPEQSSVLKNCIFSIGTFSEFKDKKHAEIEEEYIDSAISDHYISIYKNWKFLAILDSITLLTTQDFLKTTTYNVMANWTETYFGKIFIYELFRKSFLYKLNYDFRLASNNARELQNRMRLFERHYSFASISYNFLPEMIDTTIEHAFESKTEEKLINEMIDREILSRDEKRENLTNRLLIGLSILAAFSAFWDLLSLVKDLRDKETFNWPSIIWTVAIIAIVILVYAFCSKKRD